MYSCDKTLKVGMVLEWDCCTDKGYDSILDKAKNSDIDLLVFPEECSRHENFRLDNCMTEIGLNKVYSKCLEDSERIGKPIIFGLKDYLGRLYSLYVNAGAKGDDTWKHIYIKHVMTGCSAFDEENYDRLSQELFVPIKLNGFSIGLTICYECEFPVFSRIYGQQGVDLIINCTGNPVIPHKWSLFNKVRAIENKCSVLVTMKDSYHLSSGQKSLTLGYNSIGGEIPSMNVKSSESEWLKNCIYVYEIHKPSEYTECSVDNINAERVENKNYHIDIPVNNIKQLTQEGTKIDNNLYCCPIRDRQENLIVCIVDGMDILAPEKVLSMLYNPKLKAIKKKRYILVNRHANLSEKQLSETVSPVLKVRAMENFIIVILESNTFSKCYQTSFNKMSQMVMPSGNVFKVDLSRATGPEATWKDKNEGYMLKRWRNSYELLIGKISN